MSTEILDRLCVAIGDERQAAERAFQNLAGQIADGREPKPEEAAATIAAAGRTVDELRAAVTRIRDRRALRAVVDARPELLKRQEALRRQIAAAGAVLARAEELHEQKTSPISWELDEISEQLREAERAKTALFLTAPKELHDELRAVGREVDTMLARQSEMTDRRLRLEFELRQSAAQQSEREADPPATGAEQVERRSYRAQAAAHRKIIEKQIGENEAQSRTVQSQLDAKKARMVELTAQAEG